MVQAEGLPAQSQEGEAAQEAPLEPAVMAVELLLELVEQAQVVVEGEAL